MLRPIDREALREQYSTATPFPFVKIENFLDSETAREIAASYPSFEDAIDQGKTFATVNERRKVQISDSKLFPAPVARLNEALASPNFLSDLAFITGLPGLLADSQLAGGGIHLTGSGGRLDVHVDFNYLEDRSLHRRLNLLLYLNPKWEEEWGGHIQLWDKDVKICQAHFAPVFNRCIIFETSDISYHGVTPISPSAPNPRQSFAAYYYTREAPANWDGVAHSTIFKARPEERFRGLVLMPTEKAKQNLENTVRRFKRVLKGLISS